MKCMYTILLYLILPGSYYNNTPWYHHKISSVHTHIIHVTLNWHIFIDQQSATEYNSELIRNVAIYTYIYTSNLYFIYGVSYRHLKNDPFNNIQKCIYRQESTLPTILSCLSPALAKMAVYLDWPATLTLSSAAHACWPPMGSKQVNGDILTGLWFRILLAHRKWGKTST